MRPADLRKPQRQGDVSNLDDLDRLFSKIRSDHGRIDVLFANAGLGAREPLGKITESSLDLVFGVNVKGTLVSNSQLSIFVTDRRRAGATLLFATGSKKHIDELRRLAAQSGMTLDESGLHAGRKLVTAKTEEDLAFHSSSQSYGKVVARLRSLSAANCRNLLLTQISAVSCARTRIDQTAVTRWKSWPRQRACAVLVISGWRTIRNRHTTPEGYLSKTLPFGAGRSTRELTTPN
jgi:NAD(P)-dependent dehydrogenase (short-subunit alcohol dehydrogenase family)